MEGRREERREGARRGGRRGCWFGMAAVDRQLLFLDPAGGAARSAVGAMSPRRLEVGMEVGEERLRSQRSAVERAAGPRDVLRSGLRSKDSSADWKVSHSGKPVRFSKILGNLPFIMAWRGSYALRHFLMSLVSLWPTAPGTGFLENLPIFRSRPEPRFAQEPPAFVLDFLTGNPRWLTFQSAEESFGRRPDRIAPHEPSALSAALRCDIQTAPRPPRCRLPVGVGSALKPPLCGGASGGVKEVFLPEVKV